ncbi:WD40/YVTN/BNR-like repeat-containing protein [Candidatus Nitrosacidococcus sp. I8]|uniref:WD40/YVTN/BNR-like repeat-containing protein n=1 Tax=Candidatus Nitrosacidococcus sp. I8 TaxID=2942908 RepID=UPI0022274DE2|nr:glycosyl hydrolase [Candidatus Nitrosacidococcus sp. I8]CAH9019505.1 hypothetical protein NURINAE_01590 [Candidatus Nitrosacidococcus sp. I8]
MTKLNKLAMLLSIATTLNLASTTQAAQWNLLCPETDSCIGPQVFLNGVMISTFQAPALSPFININSAWLQYSNDFRSSDTSDTDQYRPQGIFEINSPQTTINPLISVPSSDSPDVLISDANAIAGADGNSLVFSIGGMDTYSSMGELIDHTPIFSDLDPSYVNGSGLTAPPVKVGNSFFIGIVGVARGDQYMYHSLDNGQTWQGGETQKASDGSNLLIGNDRYNLLANPEGTGLWANVAEFNGLGAVGLWESTDLGATWNQIDDGSFPKNTVRIVLDPNNPQIVYALSNQGLYQSQDRGVSWQLTTLKKSVYGLAFIPQEPPLKSMMVAGIDKGIMVSTDPSGDWKGMNKGLLRIPHSITNANGLLIATSAAGYFTCSQVDCFGNRQPVPKDEISDIYKLIPYVRPSVSGITPETEITVTEFYNSDIDRYSMTTEPESIGANWIPTGQNFTAWRVLGSTVGSYVCEFYGSVFPGPNSHYWTISPSDCNQLLELQEKTPADMPRWNFVKYPFMAVPAQIESGVQSCPNSYTTVYLAYNNGPALGKEPAFRYVTNHSVLEPLFNEGWIDAGIAFCVDS